MVDTPEWGLVKPELVLCWLWQLQLLVLLLQQAFSHFCHVADCADGSSSGYRRHVRATSASSSLTAWLTRTHTHAL
jgi:hypothetical protein